MYNARKESGTPYEQHDENTASNTIFGTTSAVVYSVPNAREYCIL